MKKSILSLLQALTPKCRVLSYRERKDIVLRHWARNGYGNRPRAVAAREQPASLGERLNQLMYLQTIKVA